MTASGEGDFRVIYSDRLGNTRDVVYGSIDTRVLDISADPQQCQVLPPIEHPRWKEGLGDGDKLILEMKGESATTVDNTSVIRVPIRRKSLRTGMVSDEDLKGADFGLSSTDITVGTSWTEIGSYSLSSQEKIKLGKKTRDNSTIYAQLAYT